MHMDLSTLKPAAVYALMTQVIVPRPVAWVLSDDGEGGWNLAPYSYFNAISSDPPMIMLSLGRKPDGSEKDTRVNLAERGEFVVHIAHRELAEAVTATAATLPSGVSEVEKLGLETTSMPGSAVPRLSVCRVALACTHDVTHEIGRQGVVFARVRHVHVDDAVMGEDAKGRPKVLADRLDPIARLGGGEYLTAGEVITVARPD